MVFGRKTCILGATLNLINYFARESCGFCTPCRQGLPYIQDLLQRLENGEGEEDFIPRLREMAGHMDKAYCAFAPGAAEPVKGMLHISAMGNTSAVSARLDDYCRTPSDRRYGSAGQLARLRYRETQAKACGYR
jgi:NADH:ubiquinone oxidoreductase subunit F (NADH-binding)